MGRDIFRVIYSLFVLRTDTYDRSHSVSQFLATLDFNLSRATEEEEEPKENIVFQYCVFTTVQ
jgi:hypothetical protein